MSRSWPTSPLACAQRAFDLLTVPPRPLLFDGRGLPGLPQRLLGLRELKVFLISDTTPLWVRDAAWRDLVGRARCDGPTWVIAAVGVAMPGLRRVAGMLSFGRPGDNADTDADLLEGFLQRLRTIDCDGERICGRLIDAGVRAVRRSRAQREANNVTLVDAAWSLPPAQPFDHPDWVLVRAVAAAVIAPEEQQLIAETRLGHASLRQVARRLGVSVPLAAAHRRAAERRLVEAIADGSLEWVSLEARRRRTNRSGAVGTTSTTGYPVAKPGSAGVSGSLGRDAKPRNGRGRPVYDLLEPDFDQDVTDLRPRRRLLAWPRSTRTSPQ